MWLVSMGHQCQRLVLAMGLVLDMELFLDMELVLDMLAVLLELQWLVPQLLLDKPMLHMLLDPQ